MEKKFKKRYFQQPLVPLLSSPLLFIPLPHNTSGTRSRMRLSTLNSQHALRCSALRASALLLDPKSETRNHEAMANFSFLLLLIFDLLSAICKLLVVSCCQILFYLVRVVTCHKCHLLLLFSCFHVFSFATCFVLVCTVLLCSALLLSLFTSLVLPFFLCFLVWLVSSFVHSLSLCFLISLLFLPN